MPGVRIYNIHMKKAFLLTALVVTSVHSIPKSLPTLISRMTGRAAMPCLFATKSGTKFPAGERLRRLPRGADDAAPDGRPAPAHSRHIDFDGSSRSPHFTEESSSSRESVERGSSDDGNSSGRY